MVPRDAFAHLDQKSFSALELQRQLGYKRYQPIWGLLYKLRSVRGQEGAQYKLESVVELDEDFFRIVPEDLPDEDQPRKRGKGSQVQVTVLGPVESGEVKQGDKKTIALIET